MELCGTTVTRASLHNLSTMNKLLGVPYIGQEIVVIKSGDVIPQIRSANIIKYFNFFNKE